MKLYDLKIRNFKEIRDMSIGFDGKDMTISGRNGTGKTSVAGGPVANRWQYGSKTKESKCAADGCMMWREDSLMEGYCGLGGKP